MNRAKWDAGSTCSGSRCPASSSRAHALAAAGASSATPLGSSNATGVCRRSNSPAETVTVRSAARKSRALAKSNTALTRQRIVLVRRIGLPPSPEVENGGRPQPHGVVSAVVTRLSRKRPVRQELDQQPVDRVRLVVLDPVARLRQPFDAQARDPRL